MSIGERGVILRTTPLRESDLLVVLYTESHGRVSAVARGARRSQKRFAGALSTLVLGSYQLKRPTRGELWSLDGGEVEREWTRLASDVIATAHASYVLELVASLLPAEIPDPHALELIVAVWESLAAHGPSPGVLRAVELALLDLAGHRPAIDACAACGNPIDGGALFDPSRGGAMCARCAATSRAAGTRMLEAGALAYLRDVAALAAPVDGRALDARYEAGDRTAARDALVAMIVGLVGKPLRSLEYIAKLGRSRIGG